MIGLAPGSSALKLSGAPTGVRSPGARTGAAPPLTVLIVVEPGLDGVFRHVEGLLDFLLVQGVHVHLAYSSRRSGAAMLQLVERVRAAGGRTVDLRVSNVPQPGDVRALFRLAGILRATQPDIIHAHSSKAGALARMLAVASRHAGCIYTPHAYYGLAKPGWLRVRFFNRIERLLGRVGRTIAISQDEAAFATGTLQVPAHRLSIVHNPVDSKRFRPATPDERRAARARLGLPPDAIVLATIGRMCWQKDPETAYHAVAPLCAENPQLFFLHLGWGKWKNYLLGLAQRLGLGPRLKLLDYVDDPRSFYHAIDGVLITSRYEAGWPLVLLEAMACNLPIIAARCPGMSDVGSAGLSHLWTFAPEQAGECTRSLQQWLADRAAKPHAACNHRQFATERLAPERCYGAVLELYRGTAVTAHVAPIG